MTQIALVGELEGMAAIAAAKYGFSSVGDFAIAAVRVVCRQVGVLTEAPTIAEECDAEMREYADHEDTLLP